MTKKQALATAGRLQDALWKAARKADDAAIKRDEAVLAAQAEGASHAEIQAATGLSVSRVTQVLRRARQAAAD